MMRSAAPMFSVLIPCYNVEDYVEECINSVVNQTFTSWEIIAVNDGSIDGTGDILESLAARYGEKLSLVHTVNQGQLLARREAVKRARGSYVVCLDSDDMLRDDALEVIDSVVMRHPDSVVQFKFSREPSYRSEAGPYYPNDIVANKVVDIALLRRLVCASSGFNNLCGKAIPLSAINVNDDYSEYGEVRNAEDLLQLIPIIDKASSVVFLDDVLYYYRVNEKSITHVFQPKFYDSVRAANSLLWGYVAKWDDPVCVQSVKSRWMRAVVGSVVSLSQSGYSIGRMKEELARFGSDELFVESQSADHTAFTGKEKAVLAMLERRSYRLLALAVWVYGKLLK